MTSQFVIPSSAGTYDRNMTILAAKHLLIAMSWMYGQPTIGADFGRDAWREMAIGHLARLMTPIEGDADAEAAAAEAIDAALEVEA